MFQKLEHNHRLLTGALAGTTETQSHLTARAVSNATVQADHDRLALRGSVTMNHATLTAKVKGTAKEVTQRSKLCG